jgi:hypothetical protein
LIVIALPFVREHSQTCKQDAAQWQKRRQILFLLWAIATDLLCDAPAEFNIGTMLLNNRLALCCSDGIMQYRIGPSHHSSSAAQCCFIAMQSSAGVNLLCFVSLLYSIGPKQFSAGLNGNNNAASRRGPVSSIKHGAAPPDTWHNHRRKSAQESAPAA